MSQKLSVSILGFKRVQAAFKMMSVEVRTRMQQQIKESTQRVEHGAKMRAPVSGASSRKAKGRLGAGELRDTIRSEIVEDGLTGFVKAGTGKLTRRSRALKPKQQRVLSASQAMRAAHSDAIRMNNALDRSAGVYAMVIEYGSPGQGKPAQPFLRPAKEAELPTLRKGVGNALRGAVEASAQPGAA